MHNLYMHCGAQYMPLEEIRALPIPKPQGPRHNPIPFDTFIDNVKNTLIARDVAIEDEAYAVYDNQRLFGLIQVRLSDTRNLTDYAFMVGLRGSHDQSMSRGLSVGSRVFVCDNLAFSGEQVIKTKQTLNVEERLPGLVTQAIAKFPGMFAVQESLFEDFRLHLLNDRKADALITEMLRRNVLPASKMRPLIHEWDNPTHEEHVEDGRTYWSLMNAVTQVLKPNNPERANLIGHDQRTQDLTRLLKWAMDDDERRVVATVPATDAA